MKESRVRSRLLRSQLLSLVSLLVLLALSLVMTPRALATQTDWVVNTNYPEPGDTWPAPVRGQPAQYGDYSNMETDPVGVSQSDRAAVLARLQNELAPGLNVVTFNTWKDTVEGLNAIQIISNIPIRGALFTVILPPRWTRSEQVPIVLSGTGLGDSNNKRLWKNGDTGLIGLVGLSALPGFSRIIGVYCNAGGMESQGIDTHTYQAIGAFFDFIGQNGGDKHRVVTMGSSRGGLDAIMWAANPLGLDYDVIAVFADVLPTALGTLSQHSVQTYPNLSFLFSTAAGDTELYRYGRAGGAGEYDLTALTGVPDAAQADTRSPIGSAERLKGKVLVIGHGTQDPYLPLTDFLTFDRRLDSLNIPHTTVITLGNGHNASRYIADRFAYYVRGLMTGTPDLPPPGRFFLISLTPPGSRQVDLAAFLKDGMNADPKAAPKAGLPLPFSVEVPVGAGVGLPIDIALCGAVGKPYSFRSTDAQEKVWVSESGTFGSDECMMKRAAAPDKPGNYAWTFQYDGQPIRALSNTWRDKDGCGVPLVTRVTTDQPSPAALNTAAFVSGFGLDQYAAAGEGCP